jgi:quinol monooxygenase YgiN
MYDVAMYIRLAQGNVDPSRLDDYVAFVRTALPGLAQEPGFRNAYHAVDRKRARSVILSMWDTEEQAQPAPNPEGMARLQALGLQPEGAVVFEVTDQV